jgi:hypothetical protein
MSLTHYSVTGISPSVSSVLSISNDDVIHKSSKRCIPTTIMTKATMISSLCCGILLLVSVDAFCPTNMIARSARSVVRASPDAQEQETDMPSAVNNGLARFFAFTAASVFALHPMSTLAATINVAESAGTSYNIY